MSKRYLSVAETAKLCRAALKAAFPGVRFSVRSRGAIDVSYVDGPPIAAVELVAKRYAGAYFDGMIDYQGSIYHQLDGEPVGILASFVFVKRDLSDAALEAGVAKAKAAAAWNADKLEVKANSYSGSLYVDLADGEHHMAAPDRRIMHPAAAVAAWFDQDRPAAELEPVSLVEADRLQVVGDDGYSRQTGSGWSAVKEAA